MDEYPKGTPVRIRAAIDEEGRAFAADSLHLHVKLLARWGSHRQVSLSRIIVRRDYLVPVLDEPAASSEFAYCATRIGKNASQDIRVI
jgi:hypothetical protein